MRTGVIVLIVVALLAPASWAGGEGWQALEERLGLVEEEVHPLQKRVAELEFKVLRLETKVQCLMAQQYQRPSKCRARVL